MTTRLPRCICAAAWIVFAGGVFAQGVLSTNPAFTTNIAGPFMETLSASNKLARNENTNSTIEATVSRSAGSLEEVIQRPIELPGAAPHPRPLENPSVSALRMAILALAGIVIVPCLIGACVMIAKEHRQAARICLVAAAIVGAACLLALVMVDSLG